MIAVDSIRDRSSVDLSAFGFFGFDLLCGCLALNRAFPIRAAHRPAERLGRRSASGRELDYYAPILIFLASEYRRGICQHLALWDLTLGQIQRTRYVTPHGEPLLFELGGYAYLWLDPTVVPDTAAAMPI